MDYDFIIVGSGPAGAALASSLARTAAQPSVLLLEAGGDLNDSEVRSLRFRQTAVHNPELGWGYETAPQEHLNGRRLQYYRGKGLGGTSSINFSVYSCPPQGDMEEWAAHMSDEFFSWERTAARLRALEGYEEATDDGRSFSTASDHGFTGPVRVQDVPVLDADVEEVKEVWEQCGVERRHGVNNGGIIGVGLFPMNIENQRSRVTAASAYLCDPPNTLAIRTQATVTRILVQKRRATGVLIDSKEIVHALKEVIVCAGAIDTPKLLMLSGIGPKTHLEKHGLECLVDLPGVGSNLRDHFVAPLEYTIGNSLQISPAVTNYGQSGAATEAVDLEPFLAAFLRDEGLIHSTESISGGPTAHDTIRHLLRETVPTGEIVVAVRRIAGNLVLRLVAIGMVPRSSGIVRLASPDPGENPVIDLAFNSDPFDRANMRRLVRKAMDFAAQPKIATRIIEPISVPKSRSDDNIDEYLAENGNTTWHASCTSRMGRHDDLFAVVDGDFKVYGLESLRVADMSVTPFVPNCHTTSVAYLTGIMAFERISNEYSLQH